MIDIRSAVGRAFAHTLFGLGIIIDDRYGTPGLYKTGTLAGTISLNNETEYNTLVEAFSDAGIEASIYLKELYDGSYDVCFKADNVAPKQEKAWLLQLGDAGINASCSMNGNLGALEIPDRYYIGQYSDTKFIPSNLEIVKRSPEIEAQPS